MADVFKILGQELLPGTGAVANEVDLYETPVPASATVDAGAVEVVPKALARPTQALVTSVIFCNYSATSDTFTLRLMRYDWSAAPPALEPRGDKQYLFKDVPIPANSTKILKLALTVSSGDTLSVMATTASRVSATAMGIEVR